MDDLDRFIAKRKKQSPAFARNFDKGYKRLKAECAKLDPKEEKAMAEEGMGFELLENDADPTYFPRKEKP
jgi:hypothetical protein